LRGVPDAPRVRGRPIRTPDAARATVPINKSEFYMRHYAMWPAGYKWSPIANKHMAFLNNGGSDRRP